VYNTEFLGSVWSEASQSHTLTLKNGAGIVEETAHILISANGPLASPKLPDLPGLDSFQGVYFHNLRWNSAAQLKGKRIAVVGSGSSAVQMMASPADPRAHHSY
jgi:cation diffusion facilitator CzcD-associated flavoprotein CzcO